MLQIRTDQLPVIVMVFEGALTNQDLDAYEEAMAGFFAGERFSLVLTTVDVPLPSVPWLRRLSGWLRDNRDTITAKCAGVGMHLESPMLRGALTFVNKLAPPPAPQGVFATLEETEAWARAQLGMEDPR